jgi:DNA polymerase
MTRPRDVLLQADRAMGLSHAPRRHAMQAQAPAQTAVPAVVPQPEAPARLSQPASTAPRAIPVPVSAGARLARGAEALEALRLRHDRECPHCTTATAHTQTVFGEGDPEARLMFIGEAPGETEDRAGRPFVGPAGEKLDEMIKAMGLRREDTYIANVLKSRPPGNRTPMPEEADGCGPFLAEQLLAVRPKVIVSLGGPATHWACGFTTGISRLRGTWQTWKPPSGADCPEIPVMPTYHPAYVLRTYTRQVRSEVWSDLRAVMARIRPGTQAPPT